MRENSIKVKKMVLVLSNGQMVILTLDSLRMEAMKDLAFGTLVVNYSILENGKQI